MKPLFEPLFEMGMIVATPGALDALEEAKLGSLGGQLYLGMHSTGDWGDLDASAKRENDRAIKDGNRILSIYKLSTGVKIWIITEADRSSTTILLPSEY